MRRFVVISALAFALALPSTAPAAEQVTRREKMNNSLRPRHRITYDNLFLLRFNPLGLENRFDLTYRYRLYRKGGILWRDAHLGVGIATSLSPALSAVGPTVIFQPLSVLKLSASYFFVSWFGSFDYIASYQSAHDDYSDAAIERGGDQVLNYATNGHVVRLAALVVGKIGPVVIRNSLRFYYADMNLRQGDSVFYEPRQDVMVPNEGWALANDTDLLYLTDFGLVAGVRNSVEHAFYRDEHVRPGESKSTANVPMVRMGPLLAYIFYDKPKKMFNKPTLILIVNWWLKNRYRTGQEVHQAVPYLIIGFKFEGDLWSKE